MKEGLRQCIRPLVGDTVTLALMKPPLRMATIYLADGRPAIVAALHYNSAGIYYEQDTPLIVTPGNEVKLASHIRVALGRFSFREENLRLLKVTEWSSYRASGIKSARGFEDVYLCVQIRAVNEAELLFEASAKLSREADIALSVLLNPFAEDEEVGRLLGRLNDACLRWSAVMTGNNKQSPAHSPD